MFCSHQTTQLSGAGVLEQKTAFSAVIDSSVNVLFSPRFCKKQQNLQCSLVHMLRQTHTHWENKLKRGSEESRPVETWRCWLWFSMNFICLFLGWVSHAADGGSVIQLLHNLLLYSTAFTVVTIYISTFDDTSVMSTSHFYFLCKAHTHTHIYTESIYIYTHTHTLTFY